MERGKARGEADFYGKTCHHDGHQGHYGKQFRYNQVYNAEKRLALVQLMKTGVACPAADSVSPSTDITASWEFTYDGDGTRVKQLYATYNAQGAPISALTTYYFAGGSYEIRSNGTLEKYYAFGGQTVAMLGCTWTTNGNGDMVDSCPDSTNLKYFLTDQLGSVDVVTDSNGALVSEQRYLPFGGVRKDAGTVTQTDFGYTEQRNPDAQSNSFSLGLMDYHARFYNQNIGRFVQADSIAPGGPQGLINGLYHGQTNKNGWSSRVRRIRSRTPAAFRCVTDVSRKVAGGSSEPGQVGILQAEGT